MFTRWMNFAIWQKADKDEFVGVKANLAKSFGELQDFYLFWHETCLPENSAASVLPRSEFKYSFGLFIPWCFLTRTTQPLQLTKIC